MVLLLGTKRVVVWDLQTLCIKHFDSLMKYFSMFNCVIRPTLRFLPRSLILL